LILTGCAGGGATATPSVTDTSVAGARNGC
jgi:hypothetical protein